MKRDSFDYINDNLTECDYLLKTSSGITYADFENNIHLQRAFVRSLEIIGEASKKIPDEIKKKYKNIPWKQIAGMRDKLAHDYFGVDYKVIWQTVIEDVAQIANLLANRQADK